MSEPKPVRYYASKLHEYVPKEAYQPATYKLVYMFVHAFLIASYVSVVIITNTPAILVLCSILTGISIACLFLYAHELSHGTIIRRQPYFYILQNFFWAFSGIPPTVWKRVHNQAHHHHMNTYNDPDRKTFKSEATTISYIYNVFIYPNRVIRYSITVGFAMMFYSTKHIIAVYYSRGSKPQIVTHRPDYSKKEIVLISYELIYILLFWGGIITLIGSWQAILFCLISWTIYSSLVISFIITQHLRDPVFQNLADPLLTTTSIIVPQWLDKLADWHSYHVEHHVLPGMNFDYYPVISKKLEELFPNKYERIPMLQAIKESYDKDVLIDDPLT